jgi:hypothetical protein
LGQQNPYTARLNSTYHNRYATAPTSAPFRLSDHFDEIDAGNLSKSSAGSNDSYGSDDEYLPEPSRKRRRQH